MADASTLEETRGISASILFMLFLLVANELTQTLLSKLKLKYPYLRYLQPTSITTLIGLIIHNHISSLYLIIGVIAGIFLKYAGFSVVLEYMRAGFSDFFLIVLLPPILFERYFLEIIKIC